MAENHRVAWNKERLRQQNWDALVCALPSNVLMLSGYWPIVGTAVAVMCADGGVTILAPKDEGALAQRSWATDIQTFEPSSLANLDDAVKSIVKPLSKILTGCKWIGFEHGPASEPSSYVAMHFYSGAMQAVLQEACPGAQLFPADSVLSQLKSIKTDDEVACIRKAVRVAETAFQSGAQSLSERTSEIRAAAVFSRPLSVSGTNGDAVERAGGHLSCMSGIHSGKAFGAYARSTGKEVKQGELVLTHCNSQVNGYWTDITRTYVIGEPSRRQRQMYDALFAARDAALHATQVGAFARDVDRAARDVLNDRGFGPNFKHATGHGVGFGAIDAHALPRLHPKSPDRIEKGMVFNIEPGIYFEDFGGMRQCEMVAVTEKGPELLTPFQTRVEDLIR